jgi:hypothetical protein
MESKDITLFFEAGPYIITEISKKTKAHGFCELEVGDNLHFAMLLKKTTGGRNGLYATEISISARSGEIEWTNSQNVLLNNLTNFQLRKIPCG